MDDVYGAASCTSPRARRLRAVTVCACLLALTSAASGAASPARHRPPHHRGNVSSVTPLPYVAPWQTEFVRYSTQIRTMPVTAANTNDIIIPGDQWWRIIYVSADWLTGAAVGNRLFSLIWTPPGGSLLQITQPATIPASSESRMTWMPNTVAYSVQTTGFIGYMQAPVPDMLWPPGTDIQLFVGGFQGDETRRSVTSIAVEIYTEDYTPAGAVTVPASGGTVTPLML